MQKKFINVASHEMRMRISIQAILGYTEILEQHSEKSNEIIQATKGMLEGYMI
jgi:hypothetical protein